jgi:hypothetical protein
MHLPSCCINATGHAYTKHNGQLSSQISLDTIMSQIKPATFPWSNSLNCVLLLSSQAISYVHVVHLKFCVLLLYLQHVRNTTHLILPDFTALINTWCNVTNTKIVAQQCSPSSSHVVPVWSQYSHQHLPIGTCYLFYTLKAEEIL